METNKAQEIALAIRDLSDEELAGRYREQFELLSQTEAEVCGCALEQIRRLISRNYPQAHTAAIGVDDWDNQSLLFLDGLYDSEGEFIDFDYDTIKPVNQLIANLERCYGQEEILLAIDPREKPLLIQN